MDSTAPAYGLWLLVVLNSAVFVIFAFSFFKPQTRRDWRSFGAFSAFIVALFVEMYGFPLTIFLLSGWIQARAPGLDIFSHEAGHLWSTILGIQGNSHFNWIHILSNVLLLAGFWVLASAWPVLYRAQREGQLATGGVYARVRHPQYVGFIVIMLGFLLQWPTLLTLVMFPIHAFGSEEQKQKYLQEMAAGRTIGLKSRFCARRGARSMKRPDRSSSSCRGARKLNARGPALKRRASRRMSRRFTGRCRRRSRTPPSRRRLRARARSSLRPTSRRAR